MADPVRLKALIEGSGVSFKRTSSSYVLTCPRCQKRDKLYIRKRDGRFVCWVCRETQGFRGLPEYALSEVLGLPVQDVKERLYGESDAPTPVYFDLRLSDWFEEDEVVDDDATEIPTVEMPYDYYPIDHPFARRGADYLLRERGIPLEIALEYDIHYAPARRRVVFPVKSDGRLVGWQERLIIPNRHWDQERCEFRESPKVLSSDQIPRDQTVMFEHRLKGQRHAVVCEGPVDAIKAHRCGGNIATMGKAVSFGQIELLRNHGIEKLYLALDPDAMDEVARLVRKGLPGMECYLIQPPKGYKDLGEMPFEEVEELFHRAPRVTSTSLFVAFAN